MADARRGGRGVPGVLDMKAGVAMALTAVESLRETGALRAAGGAAADQR